MVIRRAEKSHIPDLLRLLRQVGQVHHHIRPDIFPDGTCKYDAAQLETLLSDDTKPVFIAEQDGFVAGYCFCQIRSFHASSVSTCRRELYIDDLCVDETCRGQHVGTALYEHALEFARSAQCETLNLNVWCGNRSAMAFYEHLGLKPRNIMMEKKLC